MPTGNQWITLWEAFNRYMKKKLFIQLLFISLCITAYSQETVDVERKAIMIDSAYDARIELYVKQCFPEYEIIVKFGKDSSTICSMEMVLWVAPDISENQFPVLEKFMTEVAHNYNKKGIHILFEYGFVPGSVDVTYDRMFNRDVIYVSSLERATTHSRTIDLLADFNKITDMYTNRHTTVKP
jgi:hypothetical protein